MTSGLQNTNEEMVRNPSVCSSWARVYYANEQVARDEDEEVNRVHRWCVTLHATILRTVELLVEFKECDTIRFLFLKCHPGCNVENELDGSNTERGHCSNKGER